MGGQCHLTFDPNYCEPLVEVSFLGGEPGDLGYQAAHWHLYEDTWETQHGAEHTYFTYPAWRLESTTIRLSYLFYITNNVLRDYCNILLHALVNVMVLVCDSGQMPFWLKALLSNGPSD